MCPVAIFAFPSGWLGVPDSWIPRLSLLCVSFIFLHNYTNTPPIVFPCPSTSSNFLKRLAKSEGCCEYGMGCGVGELVPCSPLGLPLILLPLWGSAQQTSLLSCEHVPCFSPSTALLFIQLSLLHPVSLHIFVELSGLLLAPCLSLLAAEGREAGYGS